MEFKFVEIEAQNGPDQSEFFNDTIYTEIEVLVNDYLKKRKTDKTCHTVKDYFNKIVTLQPSRL